MYEPIKCCADAKDEVRRPDPADSRRDDVESVIPICESTSTTVAFDLCDKVSLPIPSDQRQRLASLDVFRGLTVVLMIIVDDVGGIVPAINHSPWDGLTLADYVMPFFLFIVGLALALTYKKLSCRVAATRKAIFRMLKLLIVGLFLQGGFLHGVNSLTFGVDIEKMRWMGILQVCFLARSLLVIIIARS